MSPSCKSVTLYLLGDLIRFSTQSRALREESARLSFSEPRHHTRTQTPSSAPCGTAMPYVFKPSPSLTILCLSLFLLSLPFSLFQSQSVPNLNSISFPFPFSLSSFLPSPILLPPPAPLSLALRQTKSHSSVQTAHMSHQTKFPVRFMSNLPNSFPCLPVLLPRASPPSAAVMTQSYTAFALSLHNRSDTDSLRPIAEPHRFDRPSHGVSAAYTSLFGHLFPSCLSSAYFIKSSSARTYFLTANITGDAIKTSSPNLNSATARNAGNTKGYKTHTHT